MLTLIYRELTSELAVTRFHLSRMLISSLATLLPKQVASRPSYRSESSKKWRPRLPSVTKRWGVEEGALTSTPDIAHVVQSMQSRNAFCETATVFRNDKNCSSFAISQCSRVLCYADDAHSLCAQIKELVRSDPRACHQPIEILSRSQAERPGERARAAKASALKIRHETPRRICVRALANGWPTYFNCLSTNNKRERR